MDEDFLIWVINNIKVSCIAIDESHTVSAYGNSFRPKYKKLGELKDSFPEIPFIALTATLSSEGVEDVIETLKLNTPVKYIHNLDRPSIQYNIFPKVNELTQITEIIRSYPVDSCGIVYCMTRDKTEQLAVYLNSKGIKCEAFHAGISKKNKKLILEQYVSGKLNLITATIAFGMGIDKSDVRYVIHSDVPSNMESYCQEVGRASRDGLPSEAFMLYSQSDIDKQKYLTRLSITNPLRLKIALSKINDFSQFCSEINHCRRVDILNYFDQSPEKCGNCDICLGFSNIKDALKHKIN